MVTVPSSFVYGRRGGSLNGDLGMGISCAVGAPFDSHVDLTYADSVRSRS